MQSKVSGFASELEASNQKTETRCTNIRKEVSKALSEQRQQLSAHSEAMAKKMDSVAAKVPHVALLCHVCLSVCLSVGLLVISLSAVPKTAPQPQMLPVSQT